jgi:hypothetical protein
VRQGTSYCFQVLSLKSAAGTGLATFGGMMQIIDLVTTLLNALAAGGTVTYDQRHGRAKTGLINF